MFCASKAQWYYGFLLVLLVDQAGTITFASINKKDERVQFKEIVQTFKDKWILCDRGYRNKAFHKELWDNNQVKVKITGGKERQWIENIFGFLKDKFGLERIRKVRKTESFLVRVFSMLCAYNLKINLNLSI